MTKINKVTNDELEKYQNAQTVNKLLASRLIHCN